jgi:lipoate-protein ligase A
LKFQDKAVKSVRSRVTNITEHLKDPIDLDKFSEMLMKHVSDMYIDAKVYEFTAFDKEAIQKLAYEKYSTWEWNFGYHAKYDFEKLERTSAGNVEVHLNVENGFIRNCKIYGDYFNIKETSDFESMLIGLKHDYSTISKVIEIIDIENYFKGITKSELLSCFF